MGGLLSPPLVARSDPVYLLDSTDSIIVPLYQYIDKDTEDIIRTQRIYGGVGSDFWLNSPGFYRDEIRSLLNIRKRSREKKKRPGNKVGSTAERKKTPEGKRNPQMDRAAKTPTALSVYPLWFHRYDTY